MSVSEVTIERGVITQLRAYLAQAQLPEDGRLPPERELSDALGVSRTELRKALTALETEGQLWRHVGKGTFIGSRPIDTFADIAALARRTNPAEVMRVTADHGAGDRTCGRVDRDAQCTCRKCEPASARMREAGTWRQYENWDNRLHRTIAEATQNSLLVGLFDTVNAVRRAVTWGRLRTTPLKPAVDHHSFDEHDVIVEAIENRDMSGAAAAMRVHLQSVERKLLERQSDVGT